jgi:N-acetylmuramoyl-L-alanine amidase
MRKIDAIFVHCSASDYAHHDDISVIRKWHVLPKPKGNGWPDVGYHFFITKAGHVQIGRPIDIIPSAQKGFNTGSIAICLSGLYEFTKAQFAALRKLVKKLTIKYGITSVRGHNEVNKNKTCPNFNVKKALQERTLLERFKIWLSNFS